MDKKCEKPKFTRVSNDLWYKQEWAFTGSISNITGGFDIGELGSVKRVKKSIKRDEFFDVFARDVARIYDLNQGQLDMLIYFIKNKEYHSVFMAGTGLYALLAEKCDLTPATAERYFSSMVNAKRIIRKMKGNKYRLNPEYMFTAHEAKVADFLTVHMTYHFLPEEGSNEVVQDKPRVTMQMIENLIEIYRNQQIRDKANNNLFPHEELKGAEILGSSSGGPEENV